MRSSKQEPIYDSVTLNVLQQAAERAVERIDATDAAQQKLLRELVDSVQNAKGEHYQKGDLAEFWHGETLNIDAVVKRFDVRAEVPRGVGVEDVILRDGSRSEGAQLKYYRSADATTKAISDPKYSSVEHKVVPAGQLDEVRASAERLSHKNATTRPFMEQAYRDTEGKVADRLRFEGAESKPLSEAEALRIVRQLRRLSADARYSELSQDERDKFVRQLINGDGINLEAHGLTLQQIHDWEQILRSSLDSAGKAAVMSAACNIAIFVAQILVELVKNGDISEEEVLALGHGATSRATYQAITAGVTHGVMAAAKTGVLGSSVATVSPELCSLAVVFAIKSAANFIDVARGELDTQTAILRTVEDALHLSATAVGMAVGQVLIPIPYLGALIGSMVGAMLGRMLLTQGNALFMTYAVSTGSTFFGLVDQNYEIPEDILMDAGWDVLDWERFAPDTIVFESFAPDRIDWENIRYETLGIRMIRRGVVGFRQVGYVEA